MRSIKAFLIAAGFAVCCISSTAQSIPWSQQMAATVMNNLWKDSFALDNRGARWAYDQGVILKGIEGIWLNTANPAYFNYIQKSMDFFVNKDGSINTYKPDEYNIDHVNNGRMLLLLYRVTENEKYLKAARSLREQLRTHPRTHEGGFWHKKVYPYQMWLDGLYMGQPFYAEYAWLAHEDTAFNDIANQFIWMENHARDAKTGLLYHGWDESKQQKWANPVTGVSPNFWGRAMGWYIMALVDVLDYFPANHPKRAALIDILNRSVNAIEKVQDKQSGLWYDVLNMPNAKGNYVETSASSMFVYGIAKGVRKGYLPAGKLEIARKGYDGILKQFIKVENGQCNLYGTVKVSGLGGEKNYRDGSFEYYMSEPVIVNDPKGIGAFIQAANEMEIAPTLSLGAGKTVLLDNYFNNEYRKDKVTGLLQSFHYLWDEEDQNGFSLFGHLFNNYGIDTRTLKEAPTAKNLKGANIYLIVDPDTEKETAKPNYMQPGDADAIYKWVKKGGILILLGNDKGNMEFEHFNILSDKFGIHFNEDSRNKVTGSQFEMGALHMTDANPIFKTAKKVYLKEISTLKLAGPAQAVYTEGGDILMAVSKVGKGTVFAVGDPWFYNEYVDGRKLPAEFENYKAMNDLVKWITTIKK